MNYLEVGCRVGCLLGRREGWEDGRLGFDVG